MKNSRSIGEQPRRLGGFVVMLATILSAPVPAAAAQRAAAAVQPRDHVIIRAAEPVLPMTRAAEAVVAPELAPAATRSDVVAAPIDSTNSALSAAAQISLRATAMISHTAALEGRVSAVIPGGRVSAVSPGNLGSLARSNATLIERLARGAQVTTLPSGLPINLPDRPLRTAVQLGYVLSVPGASAPGSPRKRLDTYVFDSTGLTFDASSSAYLGEFLVVLANAEDRSDASDLVNPVSVAIRAPGAQLIKPQPVQFNRLGQYETVSLSVASPREDHFQIRVSADPGDANADPVQLVVSRPRITLTPGSRSVLGWGIGTVPVTVQVSNIRSPQSYQVVVQPDAGDISPNPVPINAAGIGTARLRSESTGPVSLRVGNPDVESSGAQIRYRQPYAFFALAIAGGLLGAFILGRGRKRWPRALAIGAASGVFGVAAYAAGVTAWLQGLIGVDTLAGMTEIVVFFLGALVAFVGVQVVVPTGTGKATPP